MPTSPLLLKLKTRHAIESSRKESLAVNLFDLDRVDLTIRQLLLAGKLDLSTPIRLDPKRPDEVGVLFTCPLLAAAVVCDVLRSHDRGVGDPPTRVYLRREEDRPWSKLRGELVLTDLKDGKCILSPSVFPPGIVVTEMRPLPAQSLVD